tara:strand:+ start:148 stop:339 length:192 start_codon:yes stop_codon:yes gene_type:complete
MSNLRKSDSTEIQTVNGEVHNRVFSPELNTLLGEILAQMKINNQYLFQIVGSENEVTEEDIEQ